MSFEKAVNDHLRSACDQEQLDLLYEDLDEWELVLLDIKGNIEAQCAHYNVQLSDRDLDYDTRLVLQDSRAKAVRILKSSERDLRNVKAEKRAGA